MAWQASPNLPKPLFFSGLWNGKDPILKERLFGLHNGEGIMEKT
jgi:hypothetical protein